MRVFIGNIPFGAEDSDVRRALAQFGAVQHLRIARDANTQQSRGYGFAVLDDVGAIAAIQRSSECGGLVIRGALRQEFAIARPVGGMEMEAAPIARPFLCSIDEASESRHRNRSSGLQLAEKRL